MEHENDIVEDVTDDGLYRVAYGSVNEQSVKVMKDCEQVYLHGIDSDELVLVKAHSRGDVVTEKFRTNGAANDYFDKLVEKHGLRE